MGDQLRSVEKISYMAYIGDIVLHKFALGEIMSFGAAWFQEMLINLRLFHSGPFLGTYLQTQGVPRINVGLLSSQHTQTNNPTPAYCQWCQYSTCNGTPNVLALLVLPCTTCHVLSAVIAFPRMGHGCLKLKLPGGTHYRCLWEFQTHSWLLWSPDQVNIVAVHINSQTAVLQ